jgi:hypothetical protein
MIALAGLPSSGMAPNRDNASRLRIFRIVLLQFPFMFRKVLVANRGEIAVRVIRALREMEIASVAVYSDADRGSLAVRLADEAIYVGPPPSTESYLRVDRILDAARTAQAEAIHPGYGFLSENADFAQACEDSGFTFIGPSAASIRSVGSKTAARQLAKAAGAPIVPGIEEPVSGAAEARRIAREIGYPVLLKECGVWIAKPTWKARYATRPAKPNGRSRAAKSTSRSWWCDRGTLRFRCWATAKAI